MLYIKFEDNKVVMKTTSKEQADFYNLPPYNGELEVGYDGCEYKKGKAPEKPAVFDLEKQLFELEQKYNMPRVIREGILGNPSAYSEFNVNRARDVEEIAEQVRKLKEGK